MYYKEVGTIYLAHLKKDFFALTQPFFPNNFTSVHCWADWDVTQRNFQDYFSNENGYSLSEAQTILLNAFSFHPQRRLFGMNYCRLLYFTEQTTLLLWTMNIIIQPSQLLLYIHPLWCLISPGGANWEGFSEISESH